MQKGLQKTKVSCDEMLIMRLRYRPKSKKALPVTINEFDFFHAKYLRK